MFEPMLAILTQAFPAVAPQQSQGLSGWTWVIIFLLVVLAVWWLLTRATGEKPDIHAHHEEHHAEHEHEVEETTRSATIDNPDAEPKAPAKPDDLEIIEGIGPKVKLALNNHGIITLADLAAAELEKVRQILEVAGYSYMDPSSWAEQARLADDGKWEAFEELTARLKGGRRVD